jgi:hypothetical protein
LFSNFRLSQQTKRIKIRERGSYRAEVEEGEAVMERV